MGPVVRGHHPREVASRQERGDHLEIQLELEDIVFEPPIVVIIDVQHQEVSDVREVLQASLGPIQPCAHLQQGESGRGGHEHGRAAGALPRAVSERQIEPDQAHSHAARPLDVALGEERLAGGEDIDGLPLRRRTCAPSLGASASHRSTVEGPEMPRPVRRAVRIRP